MPTLDDVYTKFGEVAEAAQLLETQIGNLLLEHGISERNLLGVPNLAEARSLFAEVDRKTLGQLLNALRGKVALPADLEEQLSAALADRNRLNHAFYRKHNLRRNSTEGRQLMLADLDQMHERLLAAYSAIMPLSGIDISEALSSKPLDGHLPL